MQNFWLTLELKIQTVERCDILNGNTENKLAKRVQFHLIPHKRLLSSLESIKVI